MTRSICAARPFGCAVAVAVLTLMPLYQTHAFFWVSVVIAAWQADAGARPSIDHCVLRVLCMLCMLCACCVCAVRAVSAVCACGVAAGHGFLDLMGE